MVPFGPLRTKLSLRERRAIEAAIAQAEVGHRGEIQVHIEPRYPGDGPRGRAAGLFIEHGMDRTRDSTGVLLYVAEVDRKVAVHAGAGVAGGMEPGRWQAVCDAVARGYGKGDRVGGITQGLKLIGEILREAAPGEDEMGNERPNRVTVGGT
jgi:uncharacterized membrane protein